MIGLHIGNPALAQTSDDQLVYVALDTSTGVNNVLAANLLTGALVSVATSRILSYPRYTSDDGVVLKARVQGCMP